MIQHVRGYIVLEVDGGLMDYTMILHIGHVGIVENH